MIAEISCGAYSPVPIVTRVLSPMRRLIERTVRDFLTEDVERIVVDHQKAHDRMRDMISKISKRSASKIKLYTEGAKRLGLGK